MNWELFIFGVLGAYLTLWVVAHVLGWLLNRIDQREHEKAIYEARIDALSLKPQRKALPLSGMEKKR